LIDYNQEVVVRWSYKTKDLYESKGYKFTKFKDKLTVKASDLPLGSNYRVYVTCDYCGNKVYAKYCNYNIATNNGTDTYACKYCNGEKSSDINRKDTSKYYNKYLKRCAEYGYTPMSEPSDYVNARSIIKFICPKHGLQKVPYYEFVQHVHGGCSRCGKEIASGKRRLQIDEVIDIVENSGNGNKLLNPEEYVGNGVRNLRITCCDCGAEFITQLSDFQHGHIRCKHCSRSISSGERKVASVLEKYSIEFKSEQRFKECRDKNTLPFDFYLPNIRCAIEFDGQHHFYPVFGEAHHKRTVRHDAIKNKYCDDNNIKLIRIPYWDGNYIEDIICKELCLEKIS